MKQKNNNNNNNKNELRKLFTKQDSKNRHWTETQVPNFDLFQLK